MSPPRVDRRLLMLLAAVLAVDLVGVSWGLPHTLAPHPDDLAKPALRAAQELYLGESKYPKVHLVTLGVAYAPYLAWTWARGGIDLGSGIEGADAGIFTDPVGTVTTLLGIARGVSVLAHLGCVALLFVVARRLVRNDVAALVAAAIFGVAPLVTFSARTSNVDVPMTFWILVALGQYARLLERPERDALTRLSLLTIVAVCTKEQSALVLGPVCLHGAWTVLRAGGARLGRAVGDVAVALLAGVALYAVLNDVLWAPGRWVERITWWRSDLESFRQDTSATVSLGDSLLGCVDDYLHVGGFGLGVLTAAALLHLALRPSRRGGLLAVYVLLYPAVLVTALGFSQPRYMIPAVVLGALFVAHEGAAFATRATPVTRRLVGGVAVLALLANLVHAGMVAQVLALDSRGQAQRWLAERGPAGAVVETYQNENTLPGLRPIGMTPHKSVDMTRAGFERRRPAVVAISDTSQWQWNRAQREFAQWLFDGPPGYEVGRFGPDADGRSAAFLGGGGKRIWPNVAVLVRRDER